MTISAHTRQRIRFMNEDKQAQKPVKHQIKEFISQEWYKNSSTLTWEMKRICFPLSKNFQMSSTND